MIKKLDLKDRKILYQLDLNARQTDSQIAKKVGLSRDIVRYRINKLTKSGHIKRFITILNTMKLGFDWYRTFFKFQNLTLKKETEIIEWLKQKTSWVVKIEGEWDMNTGTFTKNIYEFQNILSEFTEKFNRYIERYEVAIVTKMWHHHRNYLLDKKIKIPKPELMGLNKADDKIETIDKIDYKILQVLLENARMSTVDIATKTGTTEIVVRYRIKKLIEKRIILGFRALLDIDKLGYTYFKLHINLQNFTKKEKDQINLYLLQHPNVAYTTELVGGADIEIEFQVKDTKTFYKEIEQIRKTFGTIIKNYKFMQYTKEYKFTYLPGITPQHPKTIIKTKSLTKQ